MPRTPATTAESPVATAATWNVLVRSTGEGWIPLWHTNHTEVEARAEYRDRTSDPFFSRFADYRLVEGSSMHWSDGYIPKPVLDNAGTTYAEHIR